MSLTESMRTMYLEQNYPFHKGSKYRDIIVVHKFPSACTHFFFFNIIVLDSKVLKLQLFSRLTQNVSVKHPI